MNTISVIRGVGTEYSFSFTNYVHALEFMRTRDRLYNTHVTSYPSKYKPYTVYVLHYRR